MLTRLCSSLPWYYIVGWVGYVATFAMVGSLVVDWAIILGWLTIITTTIIFYVTTIEAEYVECEWASLITIPSGLLMMFGGVEPVNYLIAVAGPLALAYGLAEYYAPRSERLARWLNIGPRRAEARAKKEAKLRRLRQEAAEIRRLEEEEALKTLDRPNSDVPS